MTHTELPREAIQYIVAKLRKPTEPAKLTIRERWVEGKSYEDKPFNILMPNCGDGKTLYTIATQLGIYDESRMIGCEVERTEYEDAVELLPEAQIVYSDPQEGTHFYAQSASLLLIDGVKLGDERDAVFSSSVVALKTGGVVALYLRPADSNYAYRLKRTLTRSFDNVMELSMPNNLGRVILGTKRETPRDTYGYSDVEVKLYDDFNHTYKLPTTRPATIKKTDFTTLEKYYLLQDSPLSEKLESTPARELPKPPMSLSLGHRALLLSAGFLDGLVEPADEDPHVVRGSAKKERYVKSQEYTETSSQDNPTMKTEVGEKILLVVRAVDSTGSIVTLMDQGVNANVVKGEETAKVKRDKEIIKRVENRRGRRRILN